MKGFRSFVAGLLLVPVLASASAFSTDIDSDGINQTKQLAGSCWIFYMGRWILIPC
jgi:hypothetical protein